jgi:hypothetical protein
MYRDSNIKETLTQYYYIQWYFFTQTFIHSIEICPLSIRQKGHQQIGKGSLPILNQIGGKKNKGKDKLPVLGYPMVLSYRYSKTLTPDPRLPKVPPE